VTARSSDHLTADAGHTNGASPEAPSPHDFGDRSDTELVTDLARGSADSLAEIYSRHGASVYRLAHQMCDPQLAQEITHEVFMALWQMPSVFDPDRNSLRSHLLMVAHRRSVERLRTGDDEWVETMGTDRRDDRASKALALCAASDLRVLLADLSGPQRQVIALTYFGGFTYRQVADQLYESEEIVKRHIRDGLLRLRQPPE
jgi:RNA polymerase sigma-70 factor (ECF subfamily)